MSLGEISVNLQKTTDILNNFIQTNPTGLTDKVSNIAQRIIENKTASVNEVRDLKDAVSKHIDSKDITLANRALKCQLLLQLKLSEFIAVDHPKGSDIKSKEHPRVSNWREFGENVLENQDALNLLEGLEESLGIEMGMWVLAELFDVDKGNLKSCTITYDPKNKTNLYKATLKEVKIGKKSWGLIVAEIRRPKIIWFRAEPNKLTFTKGGINYTHNHSWYYFTRTLKADVSMIYSLERQGDKIVATRFKAKEIIDPNNNIPDIANYLDENENVKSKYGIPNSRGFAGALETTLTEGTEHLEWFNHKIHF